MAAVLEQLFVELYREKRRKAMNRTLLEDIVWFSGIYDYKYLRIMYNLPIGFGLCYGLYYFGWQRLNFADFDPTYKEIFQWAVIFFCTLGYAFSPVFRCSLMCVLLGALGTNGQAIFSIVVFESLTDGPIENTVTNYRLSADHVICNLEIQKLVMEKRINLLSGPYQELLEEKLTNSVHEGKDTVQMLKSSVDPFTQEFEMDNEEERRLEAIIENNKAMNKRRKINERLTDEEEKEHMPFWMNFKNKMARDMARRMEERCSEISATAVKRCYESVKMLKDQCYKQIRWYVKLIFGNFCRDIDPLKSCPIEKMTKEMDDQCMKPITKGDGAVFNSHFDHDMDKIGSVSKDIREQMKLNVHYHAVQEPRLEQFRLMSDVKYKLESEVNIMKIFMKTAKEFLSALLIFFVYSIFRDCVAMLTKYLNNIDFNNVFLTKYFYYIDEKRGLMGKPTLLPLTKAEVVAFGLRSPFSLPTTAEFEASFFPLLKWFMLFLVTVVVMLVDHLYYSAVSSIMRTSNATFETHGAQTFRINVTGEGFVAGLLQDLLAFNTTSTMDMTTLNEECGMSNPVKKLEMDKVWLPIVTPLAMMLFFQVLFGFVVKRITIFYVVGFIFRRRDKARTIQLYNKLLFARSNSRKAARARIRRAVKKNALWSKSKTSLWTYLPKLLPIMDSLFRTGECLMCLEPEKKKNLEYCKKEGCTASYCGRCWEENQQLCYACLADDGVVDDQHTRMAVLREDEPGKQNEPAKQPQPSSGQ